MLLEQPKELSVPLHAATSNAKDFGWKTQNLGHRPPGLSFRSRPPGVASDRPRAARTGSRDFPSPSSLTRVN